MASENFLRRNSRADHRLTTGHQASFTDSVSGCVYVCGACWSLVIYFSVCFLFVCLFGVLHANMQFPKVSFYGKYSRCYLLSEVMLIPHFTLCHLSTYSQSLQFINYALVSTPVLLCVCACLQVLLSELS